MKRGLQGRTRSPRCGQRSCSAAHFGPGLQAPAAVVAGGLDPESLVEPAVKAEGALQDALISIFTLSFLAFVHKPINTCPCTRIHMYVCIHDLKNMSHYSILDLLE